MADSLLVPARRLRMEAAVMAQVPEASVTVVFSPYRVCPIGAHIDHQGGPVTAMALDFGVLLAFAATASPEVRLRSHQYKGLVRFPLDAPVIAARKDAAPGAEQSQGERKGSAGTTAQEGPSAAVEEGMVTSQGREEEGAQERDGGGDGNHHFRGNGTEQEQEEEKLWGNYARGAAWALMQRGHALRRGISGVVSGQQGVDCAGISSSAAVGVAYLLALAHANDITLSRTDLIELDRRVENDFLGLRNGVLDQSAIVLSQRSCLTLIRCRERTHETIPFGPHETPPSMTTPPAANDSTTANSLDAPYPETTPSVTNVSTTANSLDPIAPETAAGPLHGQAGTRDPQEGGSQCGIPPSQATGHVPPGSTGTRHCLCGACSSPPLPPSLSQPSPATASNGAPAAYPRGTPGPVCRDPPVAPGAYPGGTQDRDPLFRILLAFSGIQGALVATGSYNRRVDECREAASRLLQALRTQGQASGTPKCSDGGSPLDEVGEANGHATGHAARGTTSALESGKGSVLIPSLSDITREQYESLKHVLPGHLQRRAAHFFSECERVQRGVRAWRAGDLAQFGRCVSESGLSSIENYECGTDALIQLRELLLEAPGVLGARFSGAGFRGCCVALVWRCMAHQAAAQVAKEYEKRQPVLARNIHPGCAVVVSGSGDGARVLAL